MATSNTTFLPSEWHPQSAVQLTWPHAQTDWAPILDQVVACYLHMAQEIACRERLIIATPEPDNVLELVRSNLPPTALANISVHHIPTNDTWARDHGFITLLSPQGPQLLDFRFNGWGQKFASNLDNQICRAMYKQGILQGEYVGHLDFTLEGGSIESDGQGTILTTEQCLMAPNRNEPLSRCQIEQRLKEYFATERVLWLQHGYLAGDDTDSHVDTLARLCPGDTIAYVQCTDAQDEHYQELHLMEEELKAFRTSQGEPYRLIPLPMAKQAFDDEGNRLPATYANFLIINGAVLMPTYGVPALDQQAAEQLQIAFPEHEIVGIDCQSLIIQHGSLHCCTMQFPQGTL